MLSHRLLAIYVVILGGVGVYFGFGLLTRLTFRRCRILARLSPAGIALQCIFNRRIERLFDIEVPSSRVAKTIDAEDCATYFSEHSR